MCQKYYTKRIEIQTQDVLGEILPSIRIVTRDGGPLIEITWSAILCPVFRQLATTITTEFQAVTFVH